MPNNQGLRNTDWHKFVTTIRSEEHTSELQSRVDIVCRLLLEKKKIAAAALALSACSTTLQVYSSPEHETLGLQQGDLRDVGLAFLTPSTVTGQEEDKQSHASVFAATLQSERSELRFVSLSETISAVNRAGLAEAYRAMYQNYRETGVFDGALMRRVAQAAQVRYLAQLKLANMQ